MVFFHHTNIHNQFYIISIHTYKTLLNRVVSKMIMGEINGLERWGGCKTACVEMVVVCVGGGGGGRGRDVKTTKGESRGKTTRGETGVGGGKCLIILGTCKISLTDGRRLNCLLPLWPSTFSFQSSPLRANSADNKLIFSYFLPESRLRRQFA